MATDQPLEYRPLSAWAIAGFGLAGIYTGLVLVSASIWLVKAEPLFLPGWTILIALAGGAASLIAVAQIRNSDGILAGQKLAQAGLWLSIFVGAGYFAYSYFTGLALIQQADSFLRVKDDDAPLVPDSGFFPRLIAGQTDRKELNRAFLLSLDAGSRTGNPTNERDMQIQYDAGAKDGRGALTQFRTHPFLKLFLTTPPDKIIIEPQGVKSWTWDQHSYQVARHYKVTTPEREMQVVLLVQSSEPSAEGERRKWFLNLQKTTRVSDSPTKLGELLKIMATNARVQLDEWNTAPGRKQPPIEADWERLVPDPVRRKVVIDGAKFLSPAFQLPREVPIPAWRNLDDGRLEMNIPAGVQLGGFGLEGDLLVRTTLPFNPLEPNDNPIIWNVDRYKVNRVQFVEGK